MSKGKNPAWWGGCPSRTKVGNNGAFLSPHLKLAQDLDRSQQDARSKGRRRSEEQEGVKKRKEGQDERRLGLPHFLRQTASIDSTLPTSERITATMSGLVGYASSDEEGDIQPSKPAKIAKTGAHDVTTAAEAAAKKCTTRDYAQELEWCADTEQAKPQPAPETVAEPATLPPSTNDGPQQPSNSIPTGPSAGPTAEPDDTTSDPSRTPPASPYTTERSLVRSLTMPTHPNFSIPSSPSPPPQNSEAALALSTTTKKFDRFLELKAQGVHFNARLESSAALRNPGLVGKLREFAGISESEGYASTLAVGELGGVPVRWPEEWYVENLVKENERREKRARKERGEVEFVHARGEARSVGGSKAGTPKGGGGSEHRKGRFDR